VHIYTLLSLQRLFSGKFSFHRRITEPQINLNGTAVFDTSDGRTIRYIENGQYSLAGKMQMFYQNRIFILDEASLHIYKDDNSLLHDFLIHGPLAFPLEITHVHHCVDDHYFLTLTIQSFDSFSTFYDIKGPCKSYCIRTDYRRI